jgi:hypothetical protein
MGVFVVAFLGFSALFLTFDLLAARDNARKAKESGKPARRVSMMQGPIVSLILATIITLLNRQFHWFH